MFIRRACSSVSVRVQLPIGRSHRRYAARGGLALIVLAACSAPSPEGLFSPVLVATSAGGSSSFAGSGGETGLSPAGGAGNGEGQGGSELGFAGAGGTDVGSGGSGATATDAGLPDAGTPSEAGSPCVADDEVCDGLDNDCDGDVDPGNTCAELCTGFSVEERSYMFCSREDDRGQALDRCEDEGMRLVWLETPTESAAVREQIIASGLEAPGGNAELLTQIGGSDDEGEDGEWTWVGSDVAPNGFQFWNGASEANGGAVVGDAYVDWADGEPTSDDNEDCAAMRVLGPMAERGGWDDRSCNEQLPFLCEAP